MKLSVRQWHFCQGIRCANLKESAYIGVPRECTLEVCQHPDKRAAIIEYRRVAITEYRAKVQGGAR